MKKRKIEEKILREYWIITKIEEVMPYNMALDSHKETVANSHCYQRYVLYKAVIELRKEIFLALPKFIRKICNRLMK